jgi:hypothetical protein
MILIDDYYYININIIIILISSILYIDNMMILFIAVEDELTLVLSLSDEVSKVSAPFIVIQFILFGII